MPHSAGIQSCTGARNTARRLQKRCRSLQDARSNPPATVRRPSAIRQVAGKDFCSSICRNPLAHLQLDSLHSRIFVVLLQAVVHHHPLRITPALSSHGTSMLPAVVAEYAHLDTRNISFTCWAQFLESPRLPPRRSLKCEMFSLS